MEQPGHTLLLVDDEDDFRHSAGAALARRGFAVVEARSGAEALETIDREAPDVVVLDLKMAGMGGIETLRRLRETHPTLPVLILTGHGSFHDALAGVSLQVVDLLQKPVDVDLLAERLTRLLAGSPTAVRERSLVELMVSPDLYPRLYVEQSAAEAFASIASFAAGPDAERQGREIRSALVFDRTEQLVGTVRFADLVRLVVPRFLADAPYPTFFPGMFVAQCKLMGRRSFSDLMAKLVTVDVRAPLMAAVHLMVRHRLSALPVTDGGSLVGVLRDRAVTLEIARTMAEAG